MVTVIKKGVTMKASFRLLFCFFLFSVESMAQPSAELDHNQLKGLAAKYDISLVVLEDFVASYNFKCPQELVVSDLESILNIQDDDTELALMLEAERLQWRDIYVETRSAITCLNKEAVSKGY